MHPDIEKILVSNDMIERRLDVLAENIALSMPDEPITALVVMTGAFVFAADLLRRLNMHVMIEPVAIRSYQGKATRSTGQYELRLAPGCSLQGRNILIIDDIYDSGNTLNALMDIVAPQNPASVKTAMLLNKKRDDLPDRPGLVDFFGFEIPDKFVVGYGLDYDGLYRNLPYIGVLKEDAIRR